jgi:hypothetical protein
MGQGEVVRNYAERQSTSAIDPYAFQLSGWLKTEEAKSRKQRRSLKQLYEAAYRNWNSRVLATALRRSPGNGGRVKRSGAIRCVNKHFSLILDFTQAKQVLFEFLTFSKRTNKLFLLLYFFVSTLNYAHRH